MQDTLLTLIDDYRSKIGWLQKDSPKKLACSVAVEAGELLEPFVWMDDQQSIELDETKKQAVREEIADVLINTINLAYSLGMHDIEEIVREKIDKIKEKYPLEKFAGKPGVKYNELD